MNQALPGDTIIVLPGAYTEEVVIAKDLTLKGGGRTTVIKSPPTLTPSAQESLNGKPVAAVVRITDGAHVRMSGFSVTGRYLAAPMSTALAWHTIRGDLSSNK